jgi:hypothetical protein
MAITGFIRNVSPVDPKTQQRITEEFTAIDGAPLALSRTLTEAQQPDGTWTVVSDVPK